MATILADDATLIRPTFLSFPRSPRGNAYRVAVTNTYRGKAMQLILAW